LFVNHIFSFSSHLIPFIFFALLFWVKKIEHPSFTIINDHETNGRHGYTQQRNWEPRIPLLTPSRHYGNHQHSTTTPHKTTKQHAHTMGKDSSFRLCIASLLIIQIACWALTLLDLYHPGKPTAMLRTTMDLASLYFTRLGGQSSAALQHLSVRDITALVY